MKQIKKIDCYIEEYKNQSGKLCVRLRDKITNKKVVMASEEIATKPRLLRFFSQAKMHNRLMPTVYDRNGSDIVAVRGIVESETDDKIEVYIDVKGGGYLFE